MGDTKHLEFLQAAIARIAGHSFMAKGWSITLATAALGIAANGDQAKYALIGLLPVSMFALLDSYYLALERGFRRLFVDAVRDAAAGRSSEFKMDPGGITSSALLWAACRPTILAVHLPLAAALVMAVILFH